MGRSTWFAVLVALLAASPASAQERRWTPLFNGVNMDGWTKMNQGNWEVRDGLLRYTAGGNGWLRTNREYQNFNLVATWRFVSGPRYDSGLFLRAGEAGNPWPSQAYQVQMLTGQEGGVGNAPARPELIKPPGQWNIFQLRVVGNQCGVAINGQQAGLATNLTRPSGYIGWQGEGSVLEVAQMWIMDLGNAAGPPASAAPVLAAASAAPIARTTAASPRALAADETRRLRWAMGPVA